MSILHTWRRRTTALVTGLAVAAFGLPVSGAASTNAASSTNTSKPTVVLVHRAFADSSSWNGVVARLHHDGYPVIAAANPLRGLLEHASHAVLVSKPGITARLIERAAHQTS
jgi:alpha-beta hydrolase superfamily lysophospholipase